MVTLGWGLLQIKILVKYKLNPMNHDLTWQVQVSPAKRDRDNQQDTSIWWYLNIGSCQKVVNGCQDNALTLL